MKKEYETPELIVRKYTLLADGIVTASSGSDNAEIETTTSVDLFDGDSYGKN